MNFFKDSLKEAFVIFKDSLKKKTCLTIWRLYYNMKLIFKDNSKIFSEVKEAYAKSLFLPEIKNQS